MQKHRNFVRSKSNICLDCFISFCNCSSERGKCILRCSCFVPAMSDQISIWSRNRCRSCSRYRCRCWHCYCFLLHSLYLNNTSVFLLILPCRCYPDSSTLFPLNNSCRWYCCNPFIRWFPSKYLCARHLQFQLFSWSQRHSFLVYIWILNNDPNPLYNFFSFYLSDSSYIGFSSLSRCDLLSLYSQNSLICTAPFIITRHINPVCLSDVHNLTSCRYLYRHTKHKYDCQKHNYKSFLIPFHLHHPFASIKNQAMFLI